jgi:hypothetical protein
MNSHHRERFNKHSGVSTPTTHASIPSLKQSVRPERFEGEVGGNLITQVSF